MNPSYFCRSRSCRLAFSLVEVTAALGICAFCLLAVYALLPVGLKSCQTATEQTGAANLLSLVAVDLRETPRSARLSGFFKIPVPSNPVSGSGEPVVLYLSEAALSSTAPLADSRYRLTVRFLSSKGVDRMPTLADVLMSWPANAAPAQAQGKVRTFVAVDRN